MTKIHPQQDLALSLWARLAIIEQCSLAIAHRSLPVPEPKRAERAQRNPKKQEGIGDASVSSPPE
jgi:hypothetical protein